MNPLVSIITPCYNGEAFVGRFLDSVLAQTYDNIEMIIINDGSTDKTEEIILSYKSKFEQKGYSLIYIKQENAGQSAAINQGLKVFKGDFLCWPDSDDELTADSIQERVDFLVKNPQYGLVAFSTVFINEKNEIERYQRRGKKWKNESYFINLINGKEFYASGSYLIRSSMFRKVMPTPLQILAPRGIGQNYQLLIPIVYYYPYAFFDKIGYKCYIRKDSHSRKRHTFEDNENRILTSRNLLISLCSDLSLTREEYGKIKDMIDFRFYHDRLYNLLYSRRKDDLNHIINYFKTNNKFDDEIKNVERFIKHPIYFKLNNGLKKLLNKLTEVKK